MKISCEVIKDLLPLYVDGICSDDSKKIIEEHLLECDSCKNVLEKMQAGYKSKSIVDRNITDAESIKNLSLKWNKKLFLSMLKGIISTLLVIGVAMLLIYIFVGIKII